MLEGKEFELVLPNLKASPDPLSPPITTRYCNDVLPGGDRTNSTNINRLTLHTDVSKRLGWQYLSAVTIQESDHSVIIGAHARLSPPTPMELYYKKVTYTLHI